MAGTSVSGTGSSLGNTSLRGFGGLASGIDRDAMIEAMTAGTSSKITSQKSEMTKMQWRQEAYRSVSDKIIDLQDNYFSFVSGSNLKSASYFEKNQISVRGNSDIARYVTASGSSSMVDYLSLQAVDQTASSATMMGSKMDVGEIKTEIQDLNASVYRSNLAGHSIEFGTLTGTGDNEQFKASFRFEFSRSYKTGEKDPITGEEKTKEINYMPAPDDSAGWDELAADLNKLVEKNSGAKGKIAFEKKGDESSGFYLGINNISGNVDLSMGGYSTVLSSMGVDLSGTPKSVSFDKYNTDAQNNFQSKYRTEQKMGDYLTGQKISITYGGETRTIDLMTAADAAEMKDADGSYKDDAKATWKSILQSRLDKAFGAGKINVGLSGNGPLSFSSNSQQLSVSVSDTEVRENIGLVKNASNGVVTTSSLWENREILGFQESDYSAYEGSTGREKFNNMLTGQGIVINGTKIEGITADSTVNDLLTAINKNKEAGVKATYLSSSNQFLLVATQTGSGRDIKLGSDGNIDKNAAGASVSAKIFGVSYKKDMDGNSTGELDGGSAATGGQDATIHISYGNGVTETRTSSTNTFNLYGMKVTVSGAFGYKTEGDKAAGNFDSSQAVTFTAKANAEGVTEKVKAFFEAYNEMVKEINTQVTTRPNSAYGPLTDEQKDEMDEKSIENWEKKAKEGLLFSDSTMRGLSTNIQMAVSRLMQSGVSYTDLQSIGIQISDDYADGGTILFDEAKFKSAMENDPDKVSNIFAGGGSVKKGFAAIIEETLTPYATRYASLNGNSYGRLIEEAGSSRVPLSLTKNYIYGQLKTMEENVNQLKERLQTERDHYIKRFTSMEKLISQFNAQSSYLSQLQG